MNVDRTIEAPFYLEYRVARLCCPQRTKEVIQFYDLCV
jgi:hypothetical protein